MLSPSLHWSYLPKRRQLSLLEISDLNCKKNLIKIEKSIHRKDNFCSCFYNSFVLALNSVYYLVSKLGVWRTLGSLITLFVLRKGKTQFAYSSSSHLGTEENSGNNLSAQCFLHPASSLFRWPPSLKRGVRRELPWAIGQKLLLSAISYHLDTERVLW